MPPIISIVGRSNSGKTTLLEGIIPELKRRGYKVAIIKHAAEVLELDAVNKDTWRLSQAGSEISAISSANKLAIFKRVDGFSPQDLDQILCQDYDLLLTEGFKRSPTPKIEVHRKEQGKDLVSPPEQLIALVTDEPLDISVPQFPKDEVIKVVDLIEDYFLSLRKDEVNLFLNHRYVPLDQHMKDLLSRTLMAMASGLKGTSDIKNLHISFRRNLQEESLRRKV